MLLYENVDKVDFDDVEIDDEVLILPAPYLDIVAPDGYTYSGAPMKRYCGKSGIVTGKYKDGNLGFWVCLDIDHGRYGWSPWMYRLTENKHPEVIISALF